MDDKGKKTAIIFGTALCFDLISTGGAASAILAKKDWMAYFGLYKMYWMKLQEMFWAVVLDTCFSTLKKADIQNFCRNNSENCTSLHITSFYIEPEDPRLKNIPEEIKKRIRGINSAYRGKERVLQRIVF
jgi:hypothetical protein